MESKLTIVDRVLFLMELDMLRSMGTEQVAQIAARATEIHLETGAVVYEEGQPADSLYLLVDGEVVLDKGGEPFGRLVRGAGFGLPSILGPNETYQASARAVRDSHLLLLSRDDFFDAVAEYPEFAEAMIRSLATGIMELSRRVEELEGRLGGEDGDDRPGITSTTRIMPLGLDER
jgi:CRP-like cAMP-binding protein